MKYNRGANDLVSLPRQSMKKENKIFDQVILASRFSFILLVLLILSLTVLSAGDTKGQEILSQKLTIHFENITLKEAIQIIEYKAGVHFTYNPRKIATHQRVSLKVENEFLREICMKLFYPLDIEFRVIRNRDILLTKKLSDLPAMTLPKKKELKLIKGFVMDAEKIPLIGATIVVGGSSIGTTSDIDGSFSLALEEYPSYLNISFTGYHSQSVTIHPNLANDIEVKLIGRNLVLDQIVVGASRHLERIVEAAVTIEKLDGLTIQSSSSEGVFEALTNLKGVQIMKGSLSGPVINTRGFGNMNNLRFLMHLDGMDVTSPGFGVYANIGGVSNLDLQSMEIIPGSASALYGANAFNGILLAKSKDPFIHQGISVNLTTGITTQKAGGVNPYNNFAIRIARQIGDRFAFKIDFETLYTNDWVSNDYSQRNTNQDPLTPPDRNVALTSYDQPSYDAVNINGDEDAGSFTSVFLNDTREVTTSRGVTHDWTLGKLSRTGYREEDMFDNSISNHRINAALFYKINDDYRLEGLFKYGTQDLILRHTTNYPFYNFTLQQQKLELKGKGLTARVYTHFQDPKETWTSVFTAASIQSALLPNDQWGQRFVDAYYGEVASVTAGSVMGARSYADSGMADIGSPAYNQALRRTVENGNVYNADGIVGSRLFDNSWLWHTDVTYDFDEVIDDPSLKISLGATYRKYTLRSEGTYFSDNRATEFAEAGFDGIGYSGSIGLKETGVYGQIGKKLLNDRLHLSFIGRINDHTNFDVNFTPQLSAVYSPDSEKNHNIRLSYATGVRNPGLQEQYLNFLLSPSFVILGGINDNFDNYVDPFNQWTGDDLKQAFKDQLGYEHKGLMPERNRTIELGYKSLMADGKLLIDISSYYTTYRNFVERANLTIMTPSGDTKTHALFANIEDKVTSNGVGLSLEYACSQSYIVYANYQYEGFELTPTAGTLSDLGYISPAFNTPKNRVNFGLTKRNTDGGIGFDIASRYTSEWVFISPIGKGYIPALYTMDASISYRVDKFNLTLGVTNLTRKEYRSIIGGPAVGSLYTLGIHYNLKTN